MKKMTAILALLLFCVPIRGERSKMDFKIGDRVRLKNPIPGEFTQPGTVSGLPSGAAAAFVSVDFDDGPKGYYVLYHHVELISK